MSSMTGQFGLALPHRALGTSVTSAPSVVWSAPEPECRERGADLAAVLLAVAAHDLRQPLQMMQHACDSLSRGIRTRSELKQLESSQTAIDRMAQQLKDLLGALLVHERARGIEPRAVHVGPLLRQACLENREATSRKDISVRVVGTRACVLSDPLLLGVILRNLVSNAVKYTNRGGRVLVGCRHVGPTVRIDVLDTGIGIVGAAMPGLFEALTRLEPERCDGLGIGLFIVRKAADLLGHRIDVSSAPNRGSRFSIVVPRSE